MDKGSTSHSKGSTSHSDKQANNQEIKQKWHLPKMKRDRSEAVLEMRQMQHISGLPPRSNLFSPEPFTLPVIEVNEAPRGDWNANRVFGFQLFYRKNKAEETSGMAPRILATDLEMQRSRGSEPTHDSSGSSHKLTEQQHGPSKDLNLLTSAYISMNASVSASDKDFMVPDWVNKGAIYMLRSPVGNTILHLAAGFGNNMVEKVVKNWHVSFEFFTTINTNYDTPLHVAARAGQASNILVLLRYYLFFVRNKTAREHPKTDLEKMLMVGLTLFRNNQGNTFFHEAFMVNSHNGAMIFRAFEAPFITEDSVFEAEFKGIVNLLAPFAINKEGKSLLYLAIEGGCKDVVNTLLDICVQLELEPQGISPLLPAIIKRDIEMLEIILSKKPTWIHLKNEKEGRLPLHYAAFIGFHECVSLLIKKCASCAMERDNDGFFPIHLASQRGHVKAIQELLKWCPDPTEFVDKNGRNFLHTAAISGKYQVVSYILQNLKLEKMINQKDNNGDTPLHLATLHWHPRIVNAFTWDKRVKLALLNKNCQTALDIADQNKNQNPPLAQRLTWSALQSAGTKRSSVRVPPKDTQTPLEKEAPDITNYKDRIDTLIVVSTLMITASFAAAFTMPGDVDEGRAVLLNRSVFHLFIFALTISMYGSISTTIILILARLEDIHLTILALKCAMPLLGISLVSLSMAFLAGVYLVVSKLSWFATTFLSMAIFLVLVVVSLYILLWLPSPSTSPFLRYISFYPFLVLASVAEPKDESDNISLYPFLVLAWVAEPEGESADVAEPEGESADNNHGLRELDWINLNKELSGGGQKPGTHQRATNVKTRTIPASPPIQ